MWSQHKAIKFAAYLIAGLYSTKWLATGFDNSKLDDSLKAVASQKYESDGAFQFEESENDSFLSSFADLTGAELLISEPLFEDTSWNNSYSHKRDIHENGLSHETKMLILQLHNIYRGNVTPPAGDMEFMEWDEELARLAQIWSEGCEFKHGSPPNDYIGLFGQNLYMGTDPTGYLGLWMWFEEHHNYDLRTRTCLPDKVCGHYVQMASAGSNRLGCGLAKCGGRQFLTCHYYPPAYDGHQIYSVGKPCSQCSSKNGALCLKNLCMSWDQCKANPFDCHFARCELECQNCGRLDKENCLCECTDGWDSPDCSHVCNNSHPVCGKSPGFPSKAVCHFNQYMVRDKLCRQMCEMCNAVDDETSVHTCCNGKLCDHGYVLDLDEKQCKCKLLCPGPACESKEEADAQASLQSSDAHLTKAHAFLALWILAFIFI